MYFSCFMLLIRFLAWSSSLQASSPIPGGWDSSSWLTIWCVLNIRGTRQQQTIGKYTSAQGSPGGSILQSERCYTAVSPLGCTQAPRLSCEPALAQQKPEPCGPCAAEFPSQRQSWWSFWRVFQSKSYEIPDSGSIPVSIVRQKISKKVIQTSALDKNLFQPWKLME